MSSLLPWLALGAVGLFISRVSNGGVRDKAAPGAPESLFAGVRYLFIVRLDVSEEAARPVLESKGVENLTFSPAMVPPFWAVATAPFSTRIASFMATPQGNSTVALGQDFYGVGRLETLVRLDGQALQTP